jgi:inorganic pyrophosphatase
MIVVTSGSEYLDIDSYAGIIGCAELLNLQGMEAIAASSVLPNHSVTADVLRTDVDLKAYKPESGDKFVLVDLSIVKFFDPIVELDNVIEVIDHHPGHEKYWQEKLGEKAQIEVIGAACTLVYERFKIAGKQKQMLPATAKGLAAGILDNTLNFTAAITTERDHIAYTELLLLAKLSNDFAAKYFLDVQNIVEANIENAVKGEKKQ